LILLKIKKPSCDGLIIVSDGGDDDTATISMIYEDWALIGQQYRFF